MELLTPREAARRLGVSYPTLKQWIYKGSIRTRRTAGRVVGGEMQDPHFVTNLIARRINPLSRNHSMNMRPSNVRRCVPQKCKNPARSFRVSGLALKRC